MNANTYIAFYYYFLLAFTGLVCLMDVNSHEKYRGILSFVLLTFVFVHIGFRPLDPLFGDTRSYAAKFKEMCLYHSFETEKDYLFYYLSLIISGFTHSTTIYFCIICLGYILPIYFAFKKKFPTTYFILLFAYVCSFSFWGYGVNGLRNGLGVSFYLIGLFSEKKVLHVFYFLIAVAFHTSLLLPVLAYFIVRYMNHNPKFYYVIWGICLLLSLTYGPSIGELLESIPFFNSADERLSGYLTTTLDELSDVSFSHIGFRWDFVLYSFVPIAFGGFFIYKHQFDVPFYNLMYCIYIICNAFWLLTIYVPFNNRFAYLSWFLHPILLVSPFLINSDLIQRRKSILPITLFLNYAFTFLMWLR